MRSMKHSSRTESFHMFQAGRSERKSLALPRAVSARTCSPITPKVHRETVPADGRQAFQLLLAKCVPRRKGIETFASREMRQIQLAHLALRFSSRKKIVSL